MSLERVLFLLAIVGLVFGVALCAGCLGDQEQPGGTVSATQPPATRDGRGFGRPPAVGETTLPNPDPDRELIAVRRRGRRQDLAGDSLGFSRRGSCSRPAASHPSLL